MEGLVAEDVLPHSLPSSWQIPLNLLYESLSNTETQLSRIRDLWNKTLQKFLRGKKLERAEFYLCMSAELFTFPKDDYEKFQMLFYEDDVLCGYINPQRLPERRGVLQLKWGIPPERVRVSFLSPSQKQFFKDYDPNTWQRFDHKRRRTKSCS